MITIKDIAKKANVSEGTVDRVLHNRGGVSEKTEAKIKKIIEDNNFSVNPIASALALKNKIQIAALIPAYTATDVFWKSPYLGILKAANEVNPFGVVVTFFMFNRFDKNSYLSSFKALQETKPNAVILVPYFLKVTEEIVGELNTFNIPYLFLNINLEGFNNLAFVGQDSYTAGYIAGKLMNLSAPKSAAFLILKSQNNSTKNNAISNRIRGFKDYFKKNRPNTKSKTLKIKNLNNTAETKNTLSSFLTKNTEIKGLFVPSSRIYSIVNCLNTTDLKKLKLIGFDNTPKNIACLKNETVSFLISQKPFEQGYESVRYMTDYVRAQKNMPSTKIYVPIDILTKENVDYHERNEYVFKNKNLKNSS